MSAPPQPNGNSVEHHFAAELFSHVASLHPQENIIISPLLLEASLVLLFLGSDGATADELKSALQLKRFGSNAKMANYYADILETFANAEDTQILLLQKILLAENVAVADEFQKIAQKYFRTTAENSKLSSHSALLQHINGALAKAPLGKTTAACADTLLASLQSQQSLAVLLNVAYFQHKWFLPFSAYRTGTYDFHLSPEEQRCVPMLFDDDMFVKFAELKELDARAIELPYEHEEELAMLLVLPNRRDGLSELEQRLCAVNLCDLADRMQMESVQVLLPKFSIDFETSLRETLKKLGISTLFTKDANFKNMLKENAALPIGDLLHKVCIAVNESGSEAAPAMPYKPIVLSNSRQKFFRAEHPFYFAIRSRDVVCFAGHVTKF